MAAMIGTLIVFAILIGIAIQLSLKNRRLRQQRQLPPPQGFRGWLLLLAIMETLRPIGTIHNCMRVWTSLPAWQARVVPALLLAYLLTELFTIAAMYRRRRYFRFAILAESGLLFSLSALDAMTVSWHLANAAPLGQNFHIIANATLAIVWTIYVFKSERVRNTFIRPQPAAADIVKVF